MTIKLVTIPGRIKALDGSRRVSATISTETIDRAGDMVRSQGIDYAGFLSAGSVLWNHNQDTPIARCLSIDVGPTRVDSTCEFPQPGISAKADEVYGLIRAGVVNGTSIGFLPVETKPFGKRALDILKWVLLEWSFVSVPANAEAAIIQRAAVRFGDESEDRLRRELEVMRLTDGARAIDRELMSRLPADQARRVRQLEVALVGGRL